MNKVDIALIVSLFKTVFLLFLFTIYKMVNITDIYMSLNISVGTVMKNPNMLKLIPDHLKTKKYVSIY